MHASVCAACWRGKNWRYPEIEPLAAPHRHTPRAPRSVAPFSLLLPTGIDFEALTRAYRMALSSYEDAHLRHCARIKHRSEMSKLVSHIASRSVVVMLFRNECVAPWRGGGRHLIHTLPLRISRTSPRSLVPTGPVVRAILSWITGHPSTGREPTCHRHSPAHGHRALRLRRPCCVILADATRTRRIVRRVVVSLVLGSGAACRHPRPLAYSFSLGWAPLSGLNPFAPQRRSLAVSLVCALGVRILIPEAFPTAVAAVVCRKRHRQV